MNFLTSLRTLILALVLSIGVSYAYAAWTAPTQPPPGGNIATPVNIGDNAQIKEGNLMLNNTGGFVNGLIVRYGNVGIGTVSPTEKLDVAGAIHSSGDVCTDQAGGKCLSTAGGGSIDWSSITSRPPGLDDGDDVGAQRNTTYPIYQCPSTGSSCGGTNTKCVGQLSTQSTCNTAVPQGGASCNFTPQSCGGIIGYLVQ